MPDTFVKLLCNDESFIINYEYKTELTDSDEIRDETIDTINSKLEFELDDAMSNCLYNYSSSFSGHIDADQEIEKLFEAACNYADILYTKVSVLVRVTDAASNIAEYSIPLVDLVKQYIRDAENDGDARLAYVSYAIEKGIQEYLDQSSWHFGLVSDNDLIESKEKRPAYKLVDEKPVWKYGKNELKPAIWYAPDHMTPQSPWIIMPSEVPSFWLDTEQDDIMRSIVTGACEDSLFCWYIYECGCATPYPTDILETCPIRINTDSTAESLASDIYQFFMTQYPEMK